MAPRKYSFAVPTAQKGARLDQALAECLPAVIGQPISKARARLLIVAGAVYINGRRTRIASKAVQLGARIDAYIDFERLGTPASRQAPFKLGAERVLFEDEFVIAVDKPPGLPTQPTLDEARDNLFGAVKKFLADRDRVAQPYVGLHHRLDRDTSGVVLFTKHVDANGGVARAFKEHLAQKTYWAVVETAPGAARLPDAFTVKNYLRKDESRGKKRAFFRSVKSGGDYAETEFRVLERFADAALVEAKPRTGRTHQIRVHLSESGAPILGDTLYGARARAGVARTLLHAAALTLPHPIPETATQLHLASPLPKDFEGCLETLRRHPG